MNKKPNILNCTPLTKSKLFSIEQVELEFSNGKQCKFERLQTVNTAAVMIIPLVNDSCVLMLREYCVGTDRYELTFPKGGIDAGETVKQAANRELMEETGYAANKLKLLRNMSIAPAYMNFNTHLVLAERLYEKSLEGDEPEPLEQVEVNLLKFNEILNRDDLTEARSIAALYLIRDYLELK